MTPLPYAGWPEPATRSNGEPILAVKRLDPSVAWDATSLMRNSSAFVALIIALHTNGAHGRQEGWLCD